jgi:uncharacterized protein (TIGR02246 family)
MNSGQTQDEIESVRACFYHLLAAWNAQDAEAYAVIFVEQGNLVGFDGSIVNGRNEIGSHLSLIFKDHVTARYVAKVREIRHLAPSVVLLRAVAGMVPPGKSAINPDLNAVQTLVAVKENGEWQVAVFHNTPAQFHAQPEMAQALTEELSALVNSG